MELTTASSSEIDIITYTNNTINKIIVLFIVTISIIVLINYYLFLHFVYNKQQKNNNTNNIIHNNIHSSINDIRENKDLRWGGDFQIEDPVHIDVPLNQMKKAKQHNSNISKF